jgi:hypothetical protein
MVTKDIPQTLLNPGQPLTNWSEVVARGLKAKVPNALQRKDQSGMIQHLEFDILYEDEKLADQLRAQKSCNIIQQALHPTRCFSPSSQTFQRQNRSIRCD